MQVLALRRDSCIQRPNSVQAFGILDEKKNGEFAAYVNMPDGDSVEGE